LNISTVNILSQEDIRKALGSALRREKNVFVFKHRCASGELRDVESFISPIEVNGVELLYSIVHDITTQKVAEEEALRLNAAMRDRLMALTQPVGNTAAYRFVDYSISTIFRRFRTHFQQPPV
jgi:hypothetical protein